MKLGYVFLYVDDVEASLGFFEKAFGLPRRFYHESGYGDGVEKDLVQAHVLYNVAAIIGSAQGVKLRAAVEEKLRLDQIDTAHQNAENRRKCCSAGGCRTDNGRHLIGVCVKRGLFNLFLVGDARKRMDGPFMRGFLR